MPLFSRLGLSILPLVLVACSPQQGRDAAAAKPRAATGQAPSPKSIADYRSILARLQAETTDQAKRERAALIVKCQMQLANFGYGTKFTGELGSTTKDAFREYQRRNGLAVTGDLTPEMLAQLDVDENALKLPTPLADLFVSTAGWDMGYFEARGNWFEVGSQDRIERIMLQCYKERQTCIQAHSFEPSVPEVTIFEISEWTPERIVAGREGLCGKAELAILRGTKNLTLTDRLLKDTELCVSGWNFGNPAHRDVRVWELKDGHAFLEKQLEQYGAALEGVRVVTEPAKSAIQ